MSIFSNYFSTCIILYHLQFQRRFKLDVSMRHLGDTSTQSDTDSPKMILFHDTSPQHMANTHLSHSFPNSRIMFAAGRIRLRLPHPDTYHCAVFCLQDTG